MRFRHESSIRPRLRPGRSRRTMTLRPHRPPAPPESGRADGAPANRRPERDLEPHQLSQDLDAARRARRTADRGRRPPRRPDRPRDRPVFAVAMNVFVYWKSDSLALKANGARELRP